MKRFFLKIEYNGTLYHGWQKQKNCKTIQGEIEYAFNQLTGKNVNLTGSGRTDAGVHAYCQIAHVDLEKDWLPEKLQGALNFFLKKIPISILEVKKVDNNFHARFSAIHRVYQYKIFIRRAPLVLHNKRYWHIWKNLDIENMIKASNFLLGTHDFTTFRSANCQSDSPIKTLDEVKISKSGENIYFGFVAKSYLHHQIRSLVGSIKLVGEETWTIDHLENALKARDRTMCGALAPPDGLYFMEVKY